MGNSVFGSCGDKFVTFVKTFDENGCPIVVFTEADPKPGCAPLTCEVPLGPFLKGVTVNDNPLGITEGLIAELSINYVPYDEGVHVDGPLLGTGTAGDPLQVPVKPTNFEFVKYDPAVHTEGEVLQGTGTSADPWLIPVKECNFEYVAFDESVHAEGPIEGDGTPDAPWQIPFTPPKECEFTYTVFDSAVHTVGAVVGDGTADNPWQIPLEPEKECNFEYVAYDPQVHDLGTIEGDGTSGSPWQVPLFNLDTDLKICAVRIVNTPANGENVYSFEYDVCDINGTVVDTLTADDVPVPTFVNKQGIAQTGEIDIMQLSDFPAPVSGTETATTLMGLDINGECALYTPQPINFVYVPYDPEVHTAGVIQGEGTEASPWQVPFTPPKECNFEYTPFDETVHAAGAVVGDGTADNPWQIPLEPEKECNFSYVDFDETIHGATDSGDSPVVGDGTAANPWQIPRPCCDEGEEPCDLETVCDLAAETVNAPAGGATTNFGLTVSVLDRGNEGFSAFIPQNPNGNDSSNQSVLTQVVSAAGLDIPVPAATPGCVLSLQILWGGEGPNNRGVNQLGDLVYSVVGSDVANDSTIHYNNTADSGLYGTVIYFDAVTGAAGTNINVTLPNAMMIDPHETFKGVINWQWEEICADDGQPLTTADYNAGADVAHGFGGIPEDGNAHNSGDFVQDADCDGLIYAFGRHVLSNEAADILMINDADWLQFSGATELTDTTSWDADSGSPCQAGMGSGFVDAGATWSVDASGNRSTVDPAWIDQAWLHVGTFDCQRAGGGGEPGESTEKAIDWVAPCDGTITCTVAGTLDAVVETGESVLVTPCFGGVADAAQAVVVTTSGPVPVNFSAPDVTVLESDAGSCVFSYKAETTTGAGVANTVSIGTVSMTVGI